MISFEDFKNVELRVGKVLAAERVEDSEKLMKLRVDIGTEERQIVAGIAKYYEADELVGRQIVVVVNLAPRTLMGFESQGMLLAASDDGGSLALLTPDKKVMPGSEVR